MPLRWLLCSFGNVAACGRALPRWTVQPCPAGMRIALLRAVPLLVVCLGSLVQLVRPLAVLLHAVPLPVGRPCGLAQCVRLLQAGAPLRMRTRCAVASCLWVRR